MVAACGTYTLFTTLLLAIITAVVLVLLIGLKKTFLIEEKVLSTEEKILKIEEKIDSLLEKKE